MIERAALIIVPLLLVTPAFAQSHDNHADHSNSSSPETGMLWPTAPPVGDNPAPPAPSDHAADSVFDPHTMENARAQLRREHGGAVLTTMMVDALEYRASDGDDGYAWEGEARVGGDIHRFVFKTKGEGGDELDNVELQFLYSRAISPYFDLQAGIRHDIEPTPSRSYAVLGIEGLAPYWFEVEGAVFFSDRGEVLARVAGSYDLRITQRLILQPAAEVNFAAEDSPALGLGAGISSTEIGLRLRYELRRDFAPYIGVVSERQFGGAADYLRAAGETPLRESIVIGLRAWF